ncbi:MAG: NAD-dependent epimerase/dehydratase family protein, partial [bacterium]|nr:NAD-dependent epimerase/dehydratase family protein [bacterium]
VRLLVKIEKEFKILISIKDIYHYPTLTEMAMLISNFSSKKSKSKILNLKKESLLDSDIINNIKKKKHQETKHKKVFLTGATGFLGAYLAHQLLIKGKHIYCLVRSSNEKQGLIKFKNNLRKYDLWENRFEKKTTIVIGDITKSHLGLKLSEFKYIASNIDLIYHNAAQVNFIMPYEDIKAANVFGTQEIIRLASTQKIIPVHFISTLSVFDSWSFTKSKALESSDLDHSDGLFNGYSQSKWVAERMLKNAEKHGLPISIYRPGRVTGTLDIGEMPKNELFSRFIKGIIQCKACPDIDLMIDLTPVDFISSFIISASLKKENSGKTFHVYNPNRIHLIEVITILKKHGYKIQIISLEKWKQRLLKSTNNALFPLLAIFQDSIHNNQSLIELAQNRSKIIDSYINTELVYGAKLETLPKPGDLLDTILTVAT